MKPGLAQLILQPASVPDWGIIYTATRNLTAGLYLLCGHGAYPERSKSMFVIISLKPLPFSKILQGKLYGGILNTSTWAKANWAAQGTSPFLLPGMDVRLLLPFQRKGNFPKSLQVSKQPNRYIVFPTTEDWAKSLQPYKWLCLPELVSTKPHFWLVFLKPILKTVKFNFITKLLLKNKCSAH